MFLTLLAAVGVYTVQYLKYYVYFYIISQHYITLVPTVSVIAENSIILAVLQLVK